tara:strand:+ start:656 stop:1048 length:393 start_codon:yes stop_codon:yes gene_type:complete
MEGNKIIAEFMGAVGTPKYNPTHWDIYITGCLDVDSDNENAKHFYTPDEMEYQSDWKWLMKVVYKIEDIRFDNEDKNSFVSHHKYDVDTRGHQCTITDVQEGKVVGYGDYADKLDSTYHAIVEFIKHINQ